MCGIMKGKTTVAYQNNAINDFKDSLNCFAFGRG